MSVAGVGVGVGVSGAAAGGRGGKIAGLYDLEETLGSGHFAVVKLARHVFTGEKVAVKVIDKCKLDEVSRAHLFQEVRCMKLVQHPNVVRLYEVIDTHTKLYLVLELADGGDLYDYILKHDAGLSEALARDYFRQIVRAISYCHRLHVVHRDLKPENVVFFEKLGVVKLTDFGFSNKFCPGQKLETSCGSLAYSAPEILLGDSYDAPAVDVWSLGVILYMLVCGHAPFHEANDSETLTMIMDCKYTVPHHVSVECRRLIGRMLVREPDKRATLSQISKDPWLLGDDSGKECVSPEGITEDCLPLVSKQQLGEDDHALIVQKMVTGHIANKEQILEALDKNEYNHITATYYLLAERKLRSHGQKIIATKRPEILGVNISDMNQKSVSKSSEIQQNRLLVPNTTNIGTVLSVPRTPGDPPQRTRKCSIVREEEDDEEGSGARRGSRSEGRLHLALQERLPPTLGSPVTTSVDNQTRLTSEISKVNIHEENTRKRLGNPGMGTSGAWMSMGLKNNCFKDNMRPKSAIEHLSSPLSLSIPKIIETPPNVVQLESVKTKLSSLCDDDISVPTTAINESATISIPIRSNIVQRTDDIPQMCKTMPSSIRLLKHSLNDSTEPTNVIKCPSVSKSKENSHQQKRSKCQKNQQTLSSSSSDGSDDDSDTRKRRSSKHLNTPTHKPLPQRRDSHDDSSDSQEQGATSTGNGTSSVRISTVTSTNGSENGNGQGGNNNNNSGSSISRRHRGGRRACETRLRESQSLNRITEVQEADTVPVPPQRSKGFFHSSKLLHGFGKKPANLPVSKQNVDKKSQDSEKRSQGFSNSSRSHALEEKENCHKIVTVTEKHCLKKARLFGRYFQVHKKLCLPRLPTIPGLWGRSGRLYKAQSCGSIVRDKITSAGASSLLLVNELCKDKPLVLDPHMARIKLLANITPCNGHNLESFIDVNSTDNNKCEIHLEDSSKCCGTC